MCVSVDVRVTVGCRNNEIICRIVIETMLGCMFGRQRLVVLIALFQVYAIRVYASDRKSDREYSPLGKHHFNKYFAGWKTSAKDSEEEKDSNTKDYQLTNLCSDKLVQIVGKNGKRRSPVNARGTDPKSILATLSFKTISFGEIRIQSPRTNYYLCFSKTGKLTIRRNGNNKRCTFKEIRDDDSTETKLQSVADEKWFVGFRKNGKPLKGIAVLNTRKEKCFKFYKMEVLPQGSSSTSSGNTADANNGPFDDPYSIFSKLFKPRKSRRRTENT